MRKLLLLALGLAVSACGGGGGGDAQPAKESQRQYSLSGVVRAAGGAASDSDLNDPQAPYRSNDSVAEAQPLPNPVVLGGFASAAGTGSGGDRYSASGDLTDVYQVYLVKDQVVSLSISDYDQARPTAVDLDLYLYSAVDPDTAVATSLGLHQAESVVVPASGSYYLGVQARAGASNYVLNIGSTALQTSAEPLRLEADFVPGELIVEFRERPADRLRRALGQPLARRIPGLQRRAGADGNGLFALGELLERQRTLQGLGVGPRADTVPGFGALNSAQRLKHETLMAVKALRAREDVASVSPNYLRRPAYIPNDTHYRLQWHYPLIGLPQAWDVTEGDAAVVVAVVDTGVYLAHPDLDSALLPGYDFIADAERALDGDGLDPSADDPGDAGPTGVSSYHGTHVAGIVAAETGNGSGIAGVAPQTRVMPLRVLGKDGGTSYDVMQAVRYAAGLPNDSGRLPERRADVINLSLGGPGYSQAEQDLLDQVRARGILVTAAAGNQGSRTVIYPAGYQGVVGVGAVTPAKRRADYSNTGGHVDLVAPGGDGNDSNGDGYPDGVLSTLAKGSGSTRRADYWFYQGTSMATPHVAGVMALMKAVHPGLTPAEFDTALGAGLLTEDVAGDGAANRDEAYGYGLIDAFKAVAQANGLAAGEPLPAVLAAEPARLEFASGESSARLILRNAGGYDLQVEAVQASADWLSVSPGPEVGADGLGEYIVRVDRSGLGNASYPATISVSFTGGASNLLEIPVVMQVGGYATGDTGHLYLLLVDPDSMETVRQLERDPVSGSYEFGFTEVPPGEYYLVAGSDADNDGIVCDAGEACAAWPAVGEPQRLRVESDRGGLELYSAFNVGLGGSGGAADDSGYRRLK